MMRTVNICEANTHLSQLVEGAERERALCHHKARQAACEVSPLSDSPSAAKKRIGFLAGQFNVPRDFDRIGQTEIESLFGIRH